MKTFKSLPSALLGASAVAALLLSSQARAQLVVQDNFTGPSSSFNWKPFNGACLTAGDGTGTIPGCKNLSYYGSQTQVGGVSGTLPDPVGQGALRFTNAANNQAGGLISNFTFPNNEGLQVTFEAVSYRGDSGGTGADGADGISFFLMDGSKPAYDTGAFGGSLGYSCSNTNNDGTVRTDGTTRGYDGLAGGYLGLGLDEFGNYLNPSDNTHTGPGLQASRIGLRGAGNVSWGALHAAYPTQYPSSLSLSQQQAAVQNTCSSGYIWDYSNASSPSKTTTVASDYGYIANTATVLPNPIATEGAMTRGAANPITYKLKITPAGLMSLAYSMNGGVYQPVISNQSITASNGALPSSFRFGFAGSTGGSTNIHEIMCFNATPSDSASSSAGLNEKQTSQVQVGTQVYFAYYNPNNWAGSMTANNLVFDQTNNTVTLSSVANWDASCVLTGVPAASTCAATGAGPSSAQAPASRQILTWNGLSGVPFEWNSLSAVQQTALTLGEVPGPNRLNFLRGDRTNELNALGVGLYRARGSVLGDIVDSSPTWVGAPQSPYNISWKDNLNTNTIPEASGQSYAAFTAAYAQRTNVVYVGSNDGLLHGFRAGAYTSAGAYSTSIAPNDGQELMAYMPGWVVSDIHNTLSPPIDFSSPNYGHAFYVDASPATGELFYSGAWHTWLVGGLGAGGPALYALDITDPTRFSESNASSLVVGEVGPATIACQNVALCGVNMGNTSGTPQIRRFHNGQWGFVFGNGVGSASGQAGIYVLLINPVTTAKTFYYFPTGSATSGNGIVNVTAADLDGDHIVDYIYGVDVKGNLWRFDVTSANPSAWAVRPAPLFSTPSGQPVTTKPVVVMLPNSLGYPRVVVSFGTGQLTPMTNTSATVYASGSQYLYGIWDYDMASWNSKGSEQYASLTGNHVILPAALQQQTVTAEVATPAGGVGNGYRTISSSAICWADLASCAGSAGQFGWQFVLPDANEQVVYNPTLQDGQLLLNTLVPPVANASNCTQSAPTGWTMSINPATGGAFTAPSFVNNHKFISYNDSPVSGVEMNGTGTPSVVNTTTASALPNSTYLVTQTTATQGAVVGLNPGASVTGQRITWVEKR